MKNTLIEYPTWLKKKLFTLSVCAIQDKNILKSQGQKNPHRSYFAGLEMGLEIKLCPIGRAPFIKNPGNIDFPGSIKFKIKTKIGLLLNMPIYMLKNGLGEVCAGPGQ